ncbi:MAG: hypothetical protein EBX37_10535 [Alphaproteobacteria bacterium]|nr:hypothetical protein [Alphaproteobacteria bacterium]
MTSILRSPSQIGVREKYLIAVADVSAGSGVAANGVGAFDLSSGFFVGSVALASQVTGATGFAPRATTGGKQIVAGELFRDMGRSITVVDADGNHLALYRNVQLVSGADTEGVLNAADYGANIYVRVWAADGDNIGVARLG